MNNWVIKNIIILFLLLFYTTVVFSQRNYYCLRTKIIINGTSNFHNWKSMTNESKVTLVMTIDSGKIKAIQYLTIELPVKKIKSSEGQVMDNNTYSVLKADEYPNIIYKLEKVISLEKKGELYLISALGTISIAGVEKKIELVVTGSINKDGSVNFSVSKKMKLTDYHLKLPTILFGWIKTENEITLKCNLVMKQT